MADLHSGFRSDIQGLRALAVLTVTLFHIDVIWFAGGFLGVDIFFAISGYLITGNIVKRYQQGSFTFSDFFMRRFKRLVPASVFTVLITLIAGYFIMASSDLNAAGKSGFHALLFSSNISFWLEAGYFDADAATKPFLHFWSLSVEEQFYFVWPLLIVGVLAAFGRKALLPVLAILSVISLVAAEYFVSEKTAAVFFLMPFRVFEFGVGGLLAVSSFQIKHKLGRDIAVTLGLVLIIGSILIMDETWRMPGMLSLVPLIGCGLVLIAPGSRISHILLSNPAAVSIGNASYSIYLAHWPLIVLFKLSYGSHLSYGAKIGLLLASIIMGYAMYHAIENSFRNNKFWLSRVLLGLPQLVVLSVCLATLYLAAYTWANTRTIVQDGGNGVLITSRTDLRQATLDRRISNLPEDGAPLAKIHIVGDSHGKDFANVVTALGTSPVSHDWLPNWCQPVIGERPEQLRLNGKAFATAEQIEECNELVINIYSNTAVKNADLVIIAARWEDWAVPLIEDTLAFVKTQTGAKILVVSSGARFSETIPKLAEKSSDFANLNALASTLIDDNPTARNILIQSATKAQRVNYIDKFKLLCPDGFCAVISSQDRQLIYYDQTHLSLSGANVFARAIQDCRETGCKVLNNSVRDARRAAED